MAEVHARTRYENHFSSKIFEPAAVESDSRFIPAGKRRDQSTSELFGSYNDKELRAMPKTFEPKDDGVTAKQKKQNFLSSEVLPRTAYPNSPAAGIQSFCPRRGDPGFMEADTDDVIDPKMRRQQEHSSELFGRETPAALHHEVHDPARRLAPTDYKWFNIPENIPKGQADEVTHSDRMYKEKCSQLFDRSSPQAMRSMPHFQAQEAQEKADDHVNEQKRRHNVYYSDLFGRSTPMDVPEAETDRYHRPKQVSNPEDRITVHQDWTDSKTELVCGQRGNRSGDDPTPNARKANELHQSRVFGGNSGYSPPDLVTPVHYDNSHKVKGAVGMHTQQIHQAHLRSSHMNEDFYEEASGTKHWEVVELHLSGLAYNANEEMVRELCNGFRCLQIVKVAVEMDPVRNLCKGRAKIMVRYNPQRDSISGLVRKLEDSNLRVEV